MITGRPVADRRLGPRVLAFSPINIAYPPVLRRRSTVLPVFAAAAQPAGSQEVPITRGYPLMPRFVPIPDHRTSLAREVAVFYSSLYLSPFISLPSVAGIDDDDDTAILHGVLRVPPCWLEPDKPVLWEKRGSRG